MQELLRRQMQEYEQQHRNTMMRLELERRQLQQQMQSAPPSAASPNFNPSDFSDSPTNDPPESAKTTDNQNKISTRQMAPGTPATVNEQAACGDGVIEIDIDGDIDATTVEKVKGAFDRQRASTMQPSSVKCAGRHQINSPGGSISAAMAIGRIFRREKASLQVKDNDVCLSACVLVLAGAVERPISRSAKVGIHRPYLETTSQGSMTADQVRSAYRTMLQGMRGYLREMNVSEKLADDMLATEPEKMRILTQAELTAYGLAGVDPAERERRAVEREAREVQEASELGLDRREYMRRKILVENICPATGDEFVNCRVRIMKTGQR
jgi:hypothetical protein